MLESVMDAKLEEVFKLSGVPTYTFVEPEEYGRLLVALRTPGRGVVIEGPSGIGKTTAVTRALADLPQGGSALKLTARKRDDREIIEALPDMQSAGLIVIDDFHRLETSIRAKIADYLKLLADEEDTSTKIVILGINRAGESLIHFARDLVGRLEVIRFGRNPRERIEKLIAEGADALNVELQTTDIVESSHGSFHIAQLLCHAACLVEDVHETQTSTKQLSKPFKVVLERVADDLSMAFMEIAMKFATGPRFSREGRAPYLNILKWLSESEEWSINLQREIRRKPELRGSVSQIVDRGHLADFLKQNGADLGDLIHFDSHTSVLAVEDPKFFFFIKNLSWAKFAERVGYLNIGFVTKYDFALSFAGADRPLAKALHDALVEREMAVFYDHEEQSRILALDLEEYLAPIYRSEASFVLCLLSAEYPTRIWTKFESQQFKSRFGAESVVPIYYTTSPPGMFDESAKVGACFYDPDANMSSQVSDITDLLKQKIADFRMLPKLEPGQFYCRQCHLILNIALLVPGRTSLCSECAEDLKIK